MQASKHSKQNSPDNDELTRSSIMVIDGTERKVNMPLLYRTGTVQMERLAEGEEAEQETRTVSLSFSSEEPYERFFYMDGDFFKADEILSHKKDHVRLDWLKSGRAALLKDHNWQQQTGVVEKAEIGSDHKGHALARFGRSKLADDELNDIKDGIRQNVSVGYWIYRMVREMEGDREIVRVTDWEPYEISTVAVPADRDVGIGRSGNDAEHPITLETIQPEQKEKTMKPEEKIPEPAAVQLSVEELASARAAVLKKENTRSEEITALATRHNMRSLGDEHVHAGTSIEEFRGVVLGKIDPSKSLETPVAKLDLSSREVKNYSILRAVRGVDSALKGEGSFKDIAPFEYECSMELQNKLDRQAKGFLVPFDVQASGMWRQPDNIHQLIQNTRAAPMDTAENSNLVGTMLLAGSYIEALRAASILMSLGARQLGGLVGNVDIGRTDTPSTFGWIGEDSDATDSELNTGTISLSPKTISGAVPITRRLLKQSTPDAELLIRSDLVLGAALAIDSAGINGTGSSNQPKGILNQTGIGTVTIASAGDPTWAEMVEFETDLAESNALRGSLSYIARPSVVGAAKVKPKATNQAIFVIENNTCNGYGIQGSTQMPASGILFGNYNEVLIAMWGVLDINVDNATKAASGGLVLRAFQDVDTNIRHAASFSKNA